MDKNNQQRFIRFNKKIKYEEGGNQYSLQLRHVHHPWWLLLLLLPLLLFIKCNKDITASCIESEGNISIADMPVTIKYKAHYLWNNGKFLATDSIQKTQVTDSVGKTVFKDLPCSVFSYIFHCLNKVSFTAKSDCYAAADEKFNFHYTRHAKLKMLPYREDLHIQLLDRETGDVLPEGVLIYKYIEQEEKIDSVHADAAGIVTIPQMRYCSIMQELKGTCYGYADTIHIDIPSQSLINVNDSSALRLRPLKERFTFFVKNKETKQPIPDALCSVSLMHPGNSKKIDNRQVRTSIDGKGLAIYDNAFVLSTIAIAASKLHYKDGKLENESWTVEKFNEQDDDTRTVWLEPEPYLQEFINVDSITGKPIPGVKNEIKVTDTDGKTTTVTEISNRNGVFPVLAKEDAQVEIISIKDPEYKPKDSKYSKFKDIREEDKTIRMQPIMETLKFRTIREDKKNVLVPNCKLKITGSISGTLMPSNSGNGEFSVCMRKYENLTIVASRQGYTMNKTKVKDRNWEYLKEAQERRDIPLRPVPPCSGGTTAPKKTNEMYHQRTYGMGQEEGNASISGNFLGEPDFLTVYDGPDTTGKILIGPNKGIANLFSIPFHFTQGTVTVVIRTSTRIKDSNWEYVVNCPR